MRRSGVGGVSGSELDVVEAMDGESAFIWLCRPISGMIVQPLVGYYSNRCTSSFGRRRPFIVTGTTLVATIVFLIGFAADIGVASGDHADKTGLPSNQIYSKWT